MKRPAFQFYPADWRKDAALQSCSVAAQGLWINILCIAHECEPYGHMTVNNKPMSAAQIGRLVGLSQKECTALLAELQDAGVSSVSEEGAVFSRRMVRDELSRESRAEIGRQNGIKGKEFGALGASHGAKGGRPRNEENPAETPPPEPGQEPPQNPHPSSSSSSSTSVLNTNTASTDVLAPAFPPEKQQPPEPPDIAKPTSPDCPHLKVLELWAEILPAMPQHNADLWRGSRAEHLRARWRETAVSKKWKDQAEGLAYFRKLFAFVGKSPFLTGQTRSSDPNRPPFVIELEWLLLPTNWAKVIEGKYHTES